MLDENLPGTVRFIQAATVPQDATYDEKKNVLLRTQTDANQLRGNKR
jgi:hypothetical protein